VEENLSRVKNATQTEEKILSMYFINKAKPKVISRRLKVSREKVYKMVESAKTALLRYQQDAGLFEAQSRTINPKVWMEVQKYCERRPHELFTIRDIQSSLQSTFGRSGLASDSSIRNYMKTKL
jgi:replicative superfamily II helicase